MIKFIVVVILLLFQMTSCMSVGNEKFKLNHEKALEDVDSLSPISCSLHISHDQLRAQKELFISFKASCDSMRIYFPPGGTVTRAGLYSDASSMELIGETPSFSVMDSSNFMILGKGLKGRFFLRYGSCHWGSEMWITLN